jgi:hypothetical protein
MRRLLVVVTVVASGFGSVANAQFPFTQNSAEKCPPSSDNSCTYDYYRNRMWPAPFTAADTNSVTAIFDQQRSNGWRLHNTLSTAMFDSRTNCLTEAGKAHVKWIVTNAPQSRRVVFVLQDASQQVTSTRVESTQLAISEVLPVGPLPQIYLTDREPSGSSGVYQTAVNRAMSNSVPAPRLTSSGGSSSSGSGSGSGTP